MFGRRNEAVFDAPVPAQRLVSARVEKADVLVFVPSLGDQFVVRRIVIIEAVQVRPPTFTRAYSLFQLLMASMMNFWLMPQVSGRVVIKELSTMYHCSRSFLLFGVQYFVDIGRAFAHGKRAEFGEQVGLGNVLLGAEFLDLGHDLLDHVLIIILEIEAVFERKPTPMFRSVQGGANLLEPEINIQAL